MSRALGLFCFTLSSSAIAFLHITRHYSRGAGDRKVAAAMNTDTGAAGTDTKVSSLLPETTNTGDVCNACASGDTPAAVNDMIGSVKHYDRHVLIYTSHSQWEASIENYQEQFPYSLIKHIDDYSRDHSDSSMNIKVTAMHDASYDKEINVARQRFLIYPDNVILDVDEADVAQLASLLHRPSLLDSSGQDWKHLLPHCGLRTPSFQKLILVCIHAARDKRCGRAGPQVIAELQSLCKASNIDESAIAVRGSSHIGGHQYAGTLIVYPDAQWYGRVTKATAAELLKTVQTSGAVFARCSRGLIRSKLLKW